MRMISIGMELNFQHSLEILKDLSPETRLL